MDEKDEVFNEIEQILRAGMISSEEISYIDADGNWRNMSLTTILTWILTEIIRLRNDRST
jgi:hypothetical protein